LKHVSTAAERRINGCAYFRIRLKLFAEELRIIEQRSGHVGVPIEGNCCINIALIRHVFDAENILPDGKITKAHIHVLQVWKKEKGRWKLLARQACPLD
jgi:ketosteroid isomerase-like protein